MQVRVHFLEGAEESHECIVQVRGAATRLAEVAMAEPIGERDRSRAQRTVFVRALDPREATIAVNPKGESHIRVQHRAQPKYNPPFTLIV